MLADMKNADRERVVGDAVKLQDITSRVDPPAIWAYQPADVTVLARTLHGFVPNPLSVETYGFYSMYRA